MLTLLEEEHDSGKLHCPGTALFISFELICRKVHEQVFQTIGLDKSGCQVNIFLIYPQKHMLWVLIRSASARCF